jgi:DNA-dependent RNA polymerase auxiliary subunit epsilon
MIFKVYYQGDASEVAVREHTKTMYVEAESVREVRLKIKQEPFNVEYIEPVTGAYLHYEKEQNEDFKVLEL